MSVLRDYCCCYYAEALWLMAGWASSLSSSSADWMDLILLDLLMVEESQSMFFAKSMVADVRACELSYVVGCALLIKRQFEILINLERSALPDWPGVMFHDTRCAPRCRAPQLPVFRVRCFRFVPSRSYRGSTFLRSCILASVSTNASRTRLLRGH